MKTFLHTHQHEGKALAGATVPAGAERRVRVIVKDLLAKQRDEVLEKLPALMKQPKAKDLLSGSWDKRVADAVRPVLLGVYKAGGDRALKQVRRFPKHAAKMVYMPWGVVAESAEVEFAVGAVDEKAKARGAIEIPEWIDDPEVLAALEREMFAFAQGINQTTADALREELLEGMENGEPISQLANRISDLSDEWIEGYRSEMIARTESARAYSAGHIEAWRSTGVVDRKVWVAAADACPFCLDMNGTVIELDENFLDKGEEQEVEWGGKEISMAQDYSDVGGPPLHPNCRCAIVGELAAETDEEDKAFKGGPGSGNFGHAGRPGEVGGSTAGGGGEAPATPGSNSMTIYQGIKAGKTNEEIAADLRVKDPLKDPNMRLIRRHRWLVSSGRADVDAELQGQHTRATQDKAPKTSTETEPKVEPKADDTTPDYYKNSALAAQLHKEWGDKLVLEAPATTGAMHDHLMHLNKIPPEAAEKLRAFGSKVYLSDKNVPKIDSNEHLSGVQPRGHPKGSTWDKVPGCANWFKKEAYCGGLGGGSGHGSASLVGHEVGHLLHHSALSYAMGSDDSITTFRTALSDLHTQGYDKLGSYLKQGGKGGDAGMQEMFAEGFAHVVRFGEVKADTSFWQCDREWLGKFTTLIKSTYEKKST